MLPIDQLSPPYIRARVLKLTPASLEQARAFAAVDLDVAFDTSGPFAALVASAGLVGVVEMTVTAPSPVNFWRHVFRRGLPSLITFTPREGGRHFVRVREVAHNHWWGALAVNVLGEQLTKGTP